MSLGDWGWAAAVFVFLLHLGREIEWHRSAGRRTNGEAPTQTPEPERDTDGADWVQP